MKLSKQGFRKIIEMCSYDDQNATYTLNFSDPDKDYYYAVEGIEFNEQDFECGLWLSEVEGDLFLRCLQAYKQTLEHKEALLVDQYIATLVERLNNIHC